MNKKKSTTRKAKISKDVLAKIKKDHVKPKPKWEFLLKSGAVWTLCILTLILGALSVGITFFLLKTNDWDIREELNQSLLGFTIETLPYIWIVLFALFAFLAYYNYRHTNRGYKVSFHKLTIIGVALSLSIGGGMYATGMAETVEDEVLERFPRYEKFHNQKHERMWNNPEKGLLAGTIVEKGEESISLEGFDGKKWNVTLTNLEEIQVNRAPKKQRKKIQEKLFETGNRIKLRGIRIDENTFEAKGARPWMRNIKKRRGEKLPPKGPPHKPQLRVR